MTSYRAYMFYINTNRSNSKKDIIEKLMKHGEFMTFENEKLNKMRIWLYSADEPLILIENKILHSFTRSSEKYASDAFMNDLDMNYNIPLNGYITFPSIKTNEPSTAEINNDDCCYIRYRERPNFPFTTFDMYNNSSSVILDNEFPNDFLM